MTIWSRLRASALWRLAFAGALVVGTLGVGLATWGGGPRWSATHLPGPGLHFQAAPGGPVHWSGRLDRGAVLQGGDGTLRMELVFGAAAEEGRAARVPTDLVVVLDRSGSMAGEKMDYAKAAIASMIDHLGATDRFALVSYADYARLDIALSAPTARGHWRDVVTAVAPVGATNLSHGLETGLAVLPTPAPDAATARAQRVVLISDGLANRGDSTLEGLRGRARDAALREATLSAVGVGADFNEQVMTALADAGTGNYYFLESAHHLSAVFASEFDAAARTVASGLEIRVTPAAGVEVLDAAGYPIEWVDGVAVVRPGSLAAGQERRLWLTLRAPNDAPGDTTLGEFRLAYRAAGARHELAFAETPVVACVASRERYVDRIDRAVWEAGVVRDGYAALQQRVSQLAKDGRKTEAEEEIAAFVAENETLNQGVDSKVVADQLGRVEEMRRDLDDAFAGPDAERKRNAFSKSRGLSSQKLRREGAYAIDPEALMGGAKR